MNPHLSHNHIDAATIYCNRCDNPIPPAQAADMRRMAQNDGKDVFRALCAECHHDSLARRVGVPPL